MTGKLVPSGSLLSLYTAWWLVWITAQAWLLHSMGVEWTDAMTDACFTQLTVSLSGYAIKNSMQAYQPGSRNSLYLIIWSLALAGLCVAAQRWAIVHFVSHPTAHLEIIKVSLWMRALYAWFMILLMALLTWFWVYLEENRELEKRNQDTARLAREAELANLRMQMQPHFLFNSLNSISALIGTQPEQARTMIQQLSDFLRGTIKREERQLITLEEELRHLRLYLEIEKVRFGHRLTTTIEHDDICLGMKLPSLLLQPIVENAIKFGLYDTLGKTIITLKAVALGNQLKIEVTNPYDSQTAEPLHGTGFGLSAIRRRLYLLYGQNDLLETSPEQNIFVTRISIPQV